TCTFRCARSLDYTQRLVAFNDGYGILNFEVDIVPNKVLAIKADRLPPQSHNWCSIRSMMNNFGRQPLAAAAGAAPVVTPTTSPPQLTSSSAVKYEYNYAIDIQHIPEDYDPESPPKTSHQLIQTLIPKNRQQIINRMVEYWPQVFGDKKIDYKVTQKGIACDCLLDISLVGKTSHYVSLVLNGCKLEEVFECTVEYLSSTPVPLEPMTQPLETSDDKVVNQSTDHQMTDQWDLIEAVVDMDVQSVSTTSVSVETSQRLNGKVHKKLVHQNQQSITSVPLESTQPLEVIDDNKAVNESTDHQMADQSDLKSVVVMATDVNSFCTTSRSIETPQLPEAINDNKVINESIDHQMEVQSDLMPLLPDLPSRPSLPLIEFIRQELSVSDLKTVEFSVDVIDKLNTKLKGRSMYTIHESSDRQYYTIDC
ncbi:unnamed protein product, partial [Oppiella nova]